MIKQHADEFIEIWTDKFFSFSINFKFRIFKWKKIEDLQHHFTVNIITIRNYLFSVIKISTWMDKI